MDRAVARDRRKALASETLNILTTGCYTSTDGSENDLSERLARSKASTSSVLPGVALERPVAARPMRSATVDVVDDDTLSAVMRLAGFGCSVVALNFASAKHPGGGWLNGAQAQEEIVTRRSTLYASLTSQGAAKFYSTMDQAISGGNDGLYTHAMVYSPVVDVIRDATPAEALLPRPIGTNFITAAAVNAGQARKRGVDEAEIRRALAARAERVLALAAHKGHDGLVLGAWGCGVFKNNPEVVAGIFAQLLATTYRGTFRHVAFALRHDENRPAFERAVKRLIQGGAAVGLAGGGTSERAGGGTSELAGGGTSERAPSQPHEEMKTQRPGKKSSRRPTAIIVMGGSFAPLHAGHLAALDAGRRKAEQGGFTVLAGYLAVANDGHLRAKLRSRGEECLTRGFSADERLRVCNAVVSRIGWLQPTPCIYGSAKQCGQAMVAASHPPHTKIVTIKGSELPSLSKSKHGQELSSTFVRRETRAGGLDAVRRLAVDGVLPAEVASHLELLFAAGFSAAIPPPPPQPYPPTRGLSEVYGAGASKYDEATLVEWRACGEAAGEAARRKDWEAAQSGFQRSVELRPDWQKGREIVDRITAKWLQWRELRAVEPHPDPSAEPQQPVVAGSGVGGAAEPVAPQGEAAVGAASHGEGHKKLSTKAERRALQEAQRAAKAAAQRAPRAAVEAKFSHYLVLDFEATCEENDLTQGQWSEIIEWPCVLLDARSLTAVGEFHKHVMAYVRPTGRPRLTKFCTELTGITQAQVDAAEPIDTVARRFAAWLPTTLGTDDLSGLLPVTCGEPDLSAMLPRECARKGLQVPSVLKRYCNIKRPFGELMGISPGGMTKMLRTLNLSLEGRHHSGIDDTRNIARIAVAIAARGATIDVTGRVPRAVTL